MAQTKNSNNFKGKCKKFYERFLPKMFFDRKEQRSIKEPSHDHIAHEGNDKKAAKSASKREVALPRVHVGNHAVKESKPSSVNVSATKTELSLKDEGTFSDYIGKVRDKMRTLSNVGSGKTATKIEKNVTKRDSFNDKVSNYINRAKIKIRATTIVDNDKDASFK